MSEVTPKNRKILNESLEVKSVRIGVKVLELDTTEMLTSVLLQGDSKKSFGCFGSKFEKKEVLVHKSFGCFGSKFEKK